MPYSRPTTTVLVERIRDDFDARLPGADSRLRRSVLDVLARVLGGVASGLYGLIDWVWRQLFPDTAEGDQLQRWATTWGVTRKAASAATGTIVMTGAEGSAVPVGTLLARADGVDYQTTAAATIVAGTATVAAAAQLPGLAGMAGGATRLTLVSPVLGINAAAVVTAGGMTGGAEQEADEALRARLLDRIRQPPQGGAKTDYAAWALEVAGVTRAWVYPGQLGLGTVTVMFVIDGRPGIIPTAEEVAAVAAHIDPLRPVTAAVTVVAPVAVPLTLRLRTTPASADVRAAIQAEIDDLLRREAEPGGTILISHLHEAISIAAGEIDHEIVIPGGNVVMPTGSIAVSAPITFIA